MDLSDLGNPGELIAGLPEGPRAGLIAQNRMASLIPHFRRIQQPIIAAINGPAYGGGLALALGWWARPAAWGLFAILIPITITTHVGDPGHVGPLFKNVALMGGLIHFGVRGPGAFALHS